VDILLLRTLLMEEIGFDMPAVEHAAELAVEEAVDIAVAAGFVVVVEM
jgi:hypothetical protein